MLEKLIIRKGILQGRTVVLESDIGLPDGAQVLVGIAVPAHDSDSAKDELAQELEANEALQTIYRMRHTGRSVRQP